MNNALSVAGYIFFLFIHCPWYTGGCNIRNRQLYTHRDCYYRKFPFSNKLFLMNRCSLSWIRIDCHIDYDQFWICFLLFDKPHCVCSYSYRSVVDQVSNINNTRCLDGIEVDSQHMVMVLEKETQKYIFIQLLIDTD